MRCPQSRQAGMPNSLVLPDRDLVTGNLSSHGTMPMPVSSTLTATWPGTRPKTSFLPARALTREHCRAEYCEHSQMLSHGLHRTFSFATYN